MSAIHTLLLAFLIGVTAGLRSLLPIAALSWGARLGWFSLAGTGFAFLSGAAASISFGVLALVELVADQLPTTPARTAPPGLVARLLTGGLCGTVAAAAGGAPLGAGGLIGAAGALAGTFGGYTARKRITAGGTSDHVVATVEDLVAVGVAAFVAFHL